MAPASCVLILAGVYSTYSKWINIEIDLAKNGFYTPKRIIAIEPLSSLLLLWAFIIPKTKNDVSLIA